MLGCHRLTPQGIGCEEKLVIDSIKDFHWGELQFVIINDLAEICIIKQELINLDLKLIYRPHIQLVTKENCSTCPICQPSLVVLLVSFNYIHFKP